MLQISIRYVLYLYFGKIHSVISLKFLFFSPNRPFPIIVFENLPSDGTTFVEMALSDLPFLNTLLRRQKQRESAWLTSNKEVDAFIEKWFL